MEIHDAFLFSIPYRNNWRFIEPADLEITEDLSVDGDIEVVSQIEGIGYYSDDSDNENE